MIRKKYEIFLFQVNSYFKHIERPYYGGLSYQLIIFFKFFNFTITSN